MLTSRQQDILSDLVGEYINLAEPISSQVLLEKHNFAVSPATIRNELMVLSDKGYLEQPHTSAGRIPTDKGYRFFVDEILEKNGEESAQLTWETPFQLARNLNSLTSALAALYLPQERMFLKEGWETLLDEPEFHDQNTLRNFSGFLKDFEEYVAKFSPGFGMQIFIGRENPFSRVDDFSIMIAECDLEGKRGFVALAGPKRMTYKRNIKALKKVWNRKNQVKR